MPDYSTEQEHDLIQIRMKLSRALRPYIQPDDLTLGEHELVQVVFGRYYRDDKRTD